MVKKHNLFTGIDITSVYNHIEVEENTRRLLQFAVDKLGKYEPLRMPLNPKEHLEYLQQQCNKHSKTYIQPDGLDNILTI